jgi:hypothetical protein
MKFLVELAVQGDADPEMIRRQIGYALDKAFLERNTLDDPEKYRVTKHNVKFSEPDLAFG